MTAPAPGALVADAPGRPLCEGRRVVGGAVVVWRLERVAETTRAGLSWAARSCAERLVVEHGLFAWRGLEASGPWTKPRPVGAADADVSLSHSAGLVLVAAARGARAGADAEAAPFRAFSSPALRRRMCAPGEAEAAEVGDPAWLARLWTAKEAIAKAKGTGLAEDFRRMPVTVSPRRGNRDAEAHVAVLGDGPITLIDLFAPDAAAS